MQNKDKDTEMEKLAQILSFINELYYKKKDQLEELKNEIETLRAILDYLNSVVGKKSFQSADSVYSEHKKEITQPPSEEYFAEEIPPEKVKGTKIKRKIFSKKEDGTEELLCILNLYDLNKLEIKFLQPKQLNIRESSEDFIKIFLKEALIKIKEKNPNLKRKYSYYKESDIIETINIENIGSIEDYDLITLKIKELISI